MIPRWVHDRKKGCNCTVVGLSQVGRATVVRQSLVVCGYLFRLSCHGMRVVLSCHCRKTVAQESWVTRAFDTELLVYNEGPIYWVKVMRGATLSKSS